VIYGKRLYEPAQDDGHGCQRVWPEDGEWWPYVAHDAMKRQLDGKDARFEYGKAVGTYAGLQAAINYINSLLTEQEEDEEDF